MSGAGKLPTNLRPLYEAALRAKSHSHSPYSRYPVGAALRTATGEIVAGCNVEVSSYPCGTCAEQSAIHRAVSELGRIQIVELLVITNSSPLAFPCGLCRQVIAEFSGGQTNFPVHVTNPAGEFQTVEFAQLLPFIFTPDALPGR